MTLEALTQAERNLVYAIRNFAKFRQEFTVATLTGGSVTNFGSAVPSLGFTGGGNTDPTVGFLNVLEDIQLIENDRRNIAAFEQFIDRLPRADQGRVVGPDAAPARPGRVRAPRRPADARRRPGPRTATTSTSSRCRWASRPTPR